MSADARRGTIRGRALDAEGRPLAGARIMIASSPAPHPDLAAVSGPDGAFALGGLAPGEYEFQGFHDTLGRAQARALVTAGKASRIELRFAGGGA